MIYSVTYTAGNGNNRSRELVASDVLEARKALRRLGISPQNASITEKAKISASPTPKPGSHEAFRQKLDDVDLEIARIESEDPQNPKNFYKVLTNDDKPGDYTDGDLYEYKHLRLDYKGRGITQEIHILDIDGERVTGWFSGGNVPTLPAILQQLGNAGWKMIGHQVNQDLKSNGVTFHYYNFMRIKKGSKPDRDFPNAVENKNIISTAIESLGG